MISMQGYGVPVEEAIFSDSSLLHALETCKYKPDCGAVVDYNNTYQLWLLDPDIETVPSLPDNNSYFATEYYRFGKRTN